MPTHLSGHDKGSRQGMMGCLGVGGRLGGHRDGPSRGCRPTCSSVMVSPTPSSSTTKDSFSFRYSSCSRWACSSRAFLSSSSCGQEVGMLGLVPTPSLFWALLPPQGTSTYSLALSRGQSSFKTLLPQPKAELQAEALLLISSITSQKSAAQPPLL